MLLSMLCSIHEILCCCVVDDDDGGGGGFSKEDEMESVAKRQQQKQPSTLTIDGGNFVFSSHFSLLHSSLVVLNGSIVYVIFFCMER
jgi:hypothetical protein